MTTQNERAVASLARGNLWLLALAALLLAATLVPGRAGFVGLVARAYEQALPDFHPVFRPDLVGQVRWLYGILVSLGFCALGAYLALLRSRIVLASWLTGLSPNDGALAMALIAVVGYSGVFVSIRLARDAQRLREVAGLSLEQKERLLFGQRTGEPDYRPAAAFRERAQGRGSLAILREGRRPGSEDLFYAAYLFPIRTYLVRADNCQDAQRLALDWSEPRFDWIERGCQGSTGFDPVRRSQLP